MRGEREKERERERQSARITERKRWNSETNKTKTALCYDDSAAG